MNFVQKVNTHFIIYVKTILDTHRRETIRMQWMWETVSLLEQFDYAQKEPFGN